MKLHHRKASLDGLGRLWRYAQHARPFAPLKKKVSQSSAPSMPSNMLLHLLNGRFWRFDGWTKNSNLNLNQATYPLEINVAKKNHSLYTWEYIACFSWIWQIWNLQNLQAPPSLEARQSETSDSFQARLRVCPEIPISSSHFSQDLWYQPNR